MRICLAMFSKSEGLLQHAFLDMIETLIMHGHKVIILVHPEATILPTLTQQQHCHIERVRNLGWWDPFAIAHIRNHLLDKRPEIVITFGNRAARLCQFSAYRLMPVASICQHIKIKHITDSDAIIASSNQLCHKIMTTSYPQEHLYYLPNMVNMPPDIKLPPLSRPSPYTSKPAKQRIGVIGNFNNGSNGFNDFMEAIHLLSQREDITFQCTISADKPSIQIATDFFKRYVLNDRIQYLPLMHQLDLFLKDIDILCLPYHHQLCGIMMLHAFKHGIPVVATYHETAIDIAHHQYNALMVPTHSPTMIADALERIIRDHELQEELRKAAFKTAQLHSFQQQAKWLEDIIKQITKQYHSIH